MTLSQQTALILEAVDLELMSSDGIIRWADSAVVTTEQPPAWLIDLATLNSTHNLDFIGLLRPHAVPTLPLHWRVQIVLVAFESGCLSLRSSLPKLFNVLFIERHGAQADALDERLINALVFWDCQEDLDEIESTLRARFESLFREYLVDADEVSQVLEHVRTRSI